MWHECWKCPGGDELQKLGLLVCPYIYWLADQFGLLVIVVEMLTGGIGIGFFVG